jgi:serine/threonine protein kinase
MELVYYPDLTLFPFSIGTWRAPEEYRNDALSDKVDIFSLGNNMLTILTGQEPVLSSKTMRSKAFRRGIVDGMTGIIDPKYWNETGSKAEHALADVIQKCFAYTPEDRPTIFEVVHELERAVQEMEKEKGETRTHILQTL